jgi:hypothetical protein
VQAVLEVPRYFKPGQEVLVALVAVFLIPAIVINFRFANARHLTGQHAVSAGDEHSIARNMTPRFSDVVASGCLAIGLWLFLDSYTQIIPTDSQAVYSGLGWLLEVSDPSHFRRIEWWTGITLIVGAQTFWIGELWVRGRHLRRALTLAFVSAAFVTLGCLGLLAAASPFAPVWLRFAAPFLWIGAVEHSESLTHWLSLSTANLLLWTLVSYYVVRAAQRLSGRRTKGSVTDSA